MVEQLRERGDMNSDEPIGIDPDDIANENDPAAEPIEAEDTGAVYRSNAVVNYDPAAPEWQAAAAEWAELWHEATGFSIPPPEFIIQTHEQVRGSITTGYQLAAFTCDPLYTWVDYAVHLNELIAALGSARTSIGPMPERDEDDNNIAGTALTNEFALRFQPPNPDAELMQLKAMGY